MTTQAQSRSGKQTHLIFPQLRAADGHHPLAVTFAVTPTHNAAKQFAVERLQFSNNRVAA
ncbi:hypothetical protein ECZU25_08740 [Escherichia coli]|nr:hypothetical protein ECZU25_08740 [Escherichia coli]